MTDTKTDKTEDKVVVPPKAAPAAAKTVVEPAAEPAHEPPPVVHNTVPQRQAKTVSEATKAEMEAGKKALKGR